jgi:hypothetical protein
MFALEIGVKPEKVESVRDTVPPDELEVFLKEGGFSSDWKPGLLLVQTKIEGRVTSDFISLMVDRLFAICRLRSDALCQLGVWGPGTLSVPPHKLPRLRGNSLGFQLKTIGGAKPVTGLCTTINVLPLGYEHTVSAFEIAARQFMSIMRAAKRVHDAERLIAEKHNYPAAAAKLSGVPVHLEDMTIALFDCWKLLMRPPGEAGEQAKAVRKRKRA